MVFTHKVTKYFAYFEIYLMVKLRLKLFLVILTEMTILAVIFSRYKEDILSRILLNKCDWIQ